MPQAVPFILAAIKTYGAKILTAFIINAASSAISRALFSKDPPTPEQAKSQFRQSIPSAQIGFGRCRMTGPNLLYGTFRNYTADVLAIANGPIDAFEGFYLNDDYVPVGSLSPSGGVPAGADGRYGGGGLFASANVRIFSRTGVMPETAIAEVVTVVDNPDIWGNAHRGDGVATVGLLCKAVKNEDLNKVYPNYEIALSTVGRWMKAYDWRKDGTLGFSPDGGHRRDDPSTWEWTDNAVVNYVHDEWFNRGQNWNYRFAPTVEALARAADVCDEAVPLKDGGTEPRYTAHGWYMLNNPPKDLRQRWFDTFDGYQIERGDGAFVVMAGKYEAPTVTLNEDRILEFGWRRSRRTEDSANRLVTSYCSPPHGYTMVEGDAWLDAVNIAARGAELSAPFERQWVTSNGQTRRLAKRAMSRLKAVYAGWVVIRLSEDETELEQRYLRIQNRRGPPSMHDVVVEVVGATLDLSKRRVRVEFIVADPDIDEWDPATEEGTAPDVATPPPVAVVPAPEVLAVTVFTDDVGGGVLAPRLTVTLDDMGRDDLDYIVSWQTPTDTSYTDEPARPAEPDGGSPSTLSFNSGFVPSVNPLSVRVQSVGAAGRSAWVYMDTVGDPLEVDTTTGVGVPTNVTAADLTTSPNGARVTWRNPFGVFDYVRVFRNTSNNFGTAATVTGEIVGGSGQPQGIDDIVGPGTYWWWVVAFDADDNPGPPSDPATTTVV